MQTLASEANPNIILIARNNEGRELAPRLAFRMGVGLAQDCLEVSADASTGKLLANRPVYGGSAVAVVSCNQTPQIAAIRPKTYEPLDADAGRSGQVVNFPVEIDPAAAKTRVVDVVTEEAEGIKLEDARIVVSGGRGLGGPEPFAQLEELANLLGGRRRSIPRGGGLGLGTRKLPGGLDRQDHHARPVHHGCHIRRQPAHGRLQRLQGHRRHQQGRRRQHLQGRALRRSRRLGEGDTGANGNGARVDAIVAKRDIGYPELTEVRRNAFVKSGAPSQMVERLTVYCSVVGFRNCPGRNDYSIFIARTVPA